MYEVAWGLLTIKGGQNVKCNPEAENVKKHEIAQSVPEEIVNVLNVVKVP